MNGETLYDAISELDSRYVMEADGYHFVKHGFRVRRAANLAVAGLAVCIGLGVAAGGLWLGTRRMGRSMDLNLSGSESASAFDEVGMYDYDMEEASEEDAAEAEIVGRIEENGTEGTSEALLHEPPQMWVALQNEDQNEDQICTAVGYTWNYDNGDGTSSGVVADAISPIDYAKHTPPLLQTDGVTPFALEFEESLPDRIAVSGWSLEVQSERAPEIYEDLTSPYAFTPRPGYVYDIHAIWEAHQGRSYDGDAHYYLVTSDT